MSKDDELIYRRDLIAEINRIGGHWHSELETAGVLNLANRIPAVDAVKVVRCGECIHRLEHFRQSCIGRPKDWFCADGKRR